MSSLVLLWVHLRQVEFPESTKSHVSGLEHDHRSSKPNMHVTVSLNMIVPPTLQTANTPHAYVA